MTRERMRALRYPNDDVEAVTELVDLHLRFHTYRLGWTDRAVRRYVRDAGPLLDRLNELTRCDCTTRNAARPGPWAAAWTSWRPASPSSASRRSSTPSAPTWTGTRSWSSWASSPGVTWAEALAFLLELRLEEGPLGEEEARRRLAPGGRSSPERGDSPACCRRRPVRRRGLSPRATPGSAHRRRTPRPSGGRRRRGTAPAATS